MYLFFNVQRMKRTWCEKAQTYPTLMYFSQAKWFGGCGLFKNIRLTVYVQTHGLLLIFAFLRATDAKMCLCNLGKEWPTASNVDHNGRLASFPQSQPLRRTLNANIPMKMLSWHYRCTFYGAKLGWKCKKRCFIWRNAQWWCPHLHLRELRIISHCCEADCSLCCWWPFLAHVAMCETFDNHDVLCFISNCRYFIYSLCAFLYCKDERFYVNRLRLHHTVRSTDSSWLLQMLFTKCLTFWIYCSSDATSAFLSASTLERVNWTSSN